MATNSSRRQFLKRTGALSIAGAAAPWAMTLAAMGEAAAATATDYKALVCVFLLGGNDYANTVVHYDQASWNLYKQFRSDIALDRATLSPLAPITPLLPSATGELTRQYALPPALSASLKPVFDQKQLAILLNVGTLVQPTSKADYLAGKNLPSKLMSHNDQQLAWQSGLSTGNTSGWGGRFGEQFSLQGVPPVFGSIGISGKTLFLNGSAEVNPVTQYQVTPNGSIPVAALKTPLFGSQACSDALNKLVTDPRTHQLENLLALTMQRSINADQLLTAATSSQVTWLTAFNNDDLSNQLKMVARIIDARSGLENPRRQVFFVSTGSFDNHFNIVEGHTPLLTTVGGAMFSFNEAMKQLGLADKVTTFTASDFGRSLVSNGGGSDHGWGGHHFVMGGAVNGKEFYGRPPVIADNGINDIGQGRLLPELSLNQYAATLGKWFGLSPAELAMIFPDLAKFPQKDLGFMKPG